MRGLAQWLIAALLVAAPAERTFAGESLKILGVLYRGCEQVCQGFAARIEESGLDAEFVKRDIAQDISRLPAIIEEARAMEADLVLTWGTSVTLGVVGTLDDDEGSGLLSTIPVVFTIVADPFGTRIAEGFAGSGRANVTGTFNRVPEAVYVETIRQYDPEFEKLGLLYNRNEVNSVLKFKELQKLAPMLGIELVALELASGDDGAPDLADIPRLLKKLREQDVSWVYLGSSSLLRQNGEFFTRAAVEHSIAVLSPYEDLVREQNALLSVAVRSRDLGRLAAEQALKVLRDGKKPGDLPIARATDFAYVVNMEVARQLGRFPPFAFLQIAETVKK
ncbi:ABC transporter substrate-binding protein [Marinimicrococcus flavescens]|uniref:ABC transporter substrate-binding protein n=1 Tax=Marinimicrococcus flavescens TaxID=3031815 RepID=A0AAP3UYL5_9PROT|nr:ABC transporter substrate-binding protein [Marinimicrococcus flavescens]